MTRDDVLQLASFLGEKLQTLHNLPLPYYSQHDHCLEDKSVTLRKNDLKKTCLEVNGNHSAIPPEWELVLASLEKKKEGISKRLMQW